MEGREGCHGKCQTMFSNLICGSSHEMAMHICVIFSALADVTRLWDGYISKN